MDRRDMTVEQLMNVLLGRWRAIAIVTLAVAALALAVSLVAPRRYTATSTLFIDLRGLDALGNPTDKLQTSSQSLVTTQIDVLRSERVARKTVEKLHLDSDPAWHELWVNETEGVGDIQAYLAQVLLRKLDIQPTRDSSVISVSYSAKDPRQAADIANGMAQAYVETNLELKSEPSLQYAGWFDERTRGLRANLQAAQAKLATFQRENELIVSATPGGASQTDLETTKLNQLTAQLLEIQASRMDTSSRQAQAARDAATSSDVLGSPLVASLRAKLADAKSKLDTLKSQFGDMHPQVSSARDDLAAMQQQVDKELQSMAATVGSNDAVNRQREVQLRQAAQAQRERVLSLTRATNELAVLQKDVENAQRAQDEAVSRQSQAALQSQLLQINVLLLASASVPPLPSSPRVLLNVALGLTAGLLAGIGLALWREFRAPLIRTPDDLVLMLDVPVLGTVSKARAAAARSFNGRKRLRYFNPPPLERA
jgi:chain length determinant protein EpsF